MDTLAKGWIKDIELVSAGGRKATSELSFLDQQQNLLRDNEAQLSLPIDDGAGNSRSGVRTAEFTRVLASWIGGESRISGISPDGAGGASAG